MKLNFLHIFFKKAVFILALFILGNLYAQVYNKEVVASVKIDRNSEFYTFSATAENLLPSVNSLRYEFMVFKVDSNNNSEKNTQSNRFVIKEHEKKIVSVVTINNNVEGKVIIVFFIYDLNNKPIGKDRIVLENKGSLLEITEIDNPDRNITSLDQAKPQDGFVLNGFVIENTITKAGRDFYKYFYAEYFNKGILTTKNIIIEEVPVRSRFTRISVKVEDQLVWQFFSQPKKEFLKQMAKTALARSIIRLQQLEKQNDELIQY